MKSHPNYKSRFRILKNGKISLVISALIGSMTILSASPSGGIVTSGSATIAQSGATTNITQSTNKAAINWQNFSIGVSETVNFAQPNVNSITLNRVVGNERSIISGTLNANGQVWILNSNGVLFNSTASINTAGLLATTKALNDIDFNAGNYNFKGDSTASVINMGTINITAGGYASLLANTVSNEGTITAIRGKVTLTGASEATINLNGNSLVNLTVDKGVLDALVENKGAVYADGGEIYLTTNAVNELLKGVVNNTGIIEANSLDDVAGRVELFAHGGTMQVGGTIEAKDGFVETSGQEFVIQPNATIKAGEWLIDPVNITIDSTLAGTIQTALGVGDVTVSTTGGNTPDTASGESGTDGDINVNADIAWNANTLILSAYRDIWIRGDLTGTGTAKLGLEYGQYLTNSSTDNMGAYTILGSLSLPATSFYAKLGSDGATTPKEIPIFINNGALRFGKGQVNSILSTGVLDQPFYYNSTANQWYKLTYSSQPLIINIGVTGSGYSDGQVINSSTNSGYFTNTLFDTFSFDNGRGILISTTTISVPDGGSGSYTFELENTYTIEAGNSYLSTVSKITNTSGISLNNVRYWTGTSDDFIGTNDSPTKTRGNLTSDGFVAITNQTDQAQALIITDGSAPTNPGVLFFSTLDTANVAVSVSNRSTNFSTFTPDDSPIESTSDRSYALYANFGTLANNANAQMNWYYAAGNVGDLSTIATTVNEVATTPTPTPTVPEQAVTPAPTNIITAIVNTNAIKVEVPKPVVNAGTQLSQSSTSAPKSNLIVSNTLSNGSIAQTLGLAEGSLVSLVSLAKEGEVLQPVSLSEVKILMLENAPASENNDGAPANIQEIRVSISENSIVELVNGGVNLPEGVEQEFYIVKNENTNGENK